MIWLKGLKIVDRTMSGTGVLKENFEFKFSDINLFVGGQGCGKSTLLSLIQKQHSDISLELSDECLVKGVESFYFDSEKDNPRIKDLRDYTNADGSNRGIGLGSAISSRFKSHGQILEKFTIEPIMSAKNCVIILDEPESGLSITNQFRLIKEIKGAISRGCQFFIASHCYPLIVNSDRVISLDHWEEMSGMEYVKRIKSEMKN